MLQSLFPSCGKLLTLLPLALTIFGNKCFGHEANYTRGGWAPLQQTNIEGKLTSVRPNDIILSQPLIARSIANLKAAYNFKGMKLNPEEELFGIEMRETGKLLFCSQKMHPNGNLFGKQFYCLEDSDNDGQFDGRRGTFLTSFPFTSDIPGVDLVWEREEIPPVSYMKFIETAETSKRAIIVRLKRIDLKRSRVQFSVAYEHQHKWRVNPDIHDVDLSKLPNIVQILDARIEVRSWTKDSLDVAILHQFSNDVATRAISAP